jgi:hypothetical protein
MEFAACGTLFLTAASRAISMCSGGRPAWCRSYIALYAASRGSVTAPVSISHQPAGRLAGSPPAATAEATAVPRRGPAQPPVPQTSATEVVAGSGISTARQSGTLPRQSAGRHTPQYVWGKMVGTRRLELLTSTVARCQLH